MTQIPLARRMLEMPMKKTRFFVCFEILEEGLKFVRLFFLCFQVENKATNMYKTFYLHPNKKTMQGNKKPRKTRQTNYNLDYIMLNP